MDANSYANSHPFYNTVLLFVPLKRTRYFLRDPLDNNILTL